MRKLVVKGYKKNAPKKTVAKKKLRKASTKKISLRLYKTYDYQFDPVIEEVFNLLKASEMKIGEASKESGVSATTLYNWHNGKTRRPQSATVEAVGRAAGYGRKWVKINDK